ncbi:hypothetical protein CTI14_71110, partial [Methylobacterium radiotolerans]
VILFHPAEGVRHVVEVQLGSADADQLDRAVRHTRPDQFAVILFHPAEGVRHVVEVQLGSADADQLDRAVRH